MSGDAPGILALPAVLGVSVDPGLLELALTHRSYAYEHGGVPTNERLEFLGDSILGQAVTVMLYREYPRLNEGDLAKRRASLVSSVALAEIARGIGLGDFIRLGRGEILTGGRDKGSILADTVEALIGAVYLDSGGEVATQLVLRLIAPLLNDPGHFGVSMDPKTSLQEAAARLGSGVPVYEIAESGPDHSKVFIATVTVGIISASGEGTSKKHAEMAAALDAWTLLSDL
ncbi:ribonuclease III [Cryobacterium algoritolerans]|uniref:Ribonuclease 3 n=1 Tax=Cryobacterium algoritolerans TaxID=1259184 RepID=A0A4R8WWX9_9MICO|nr:ribonuclease III [Cryobacterium algoritolerans]MBC7589975.1 ribonuclease III [Salinibacterium sp.]TFC18964.1 ribonuclease III [Cryobacterium algoritolerans]